MKLWAITSYFNPTGYRRRRENYRIFQRNLNVPLVAVELSFHPHFELQLSDADVVVQLRGGDIMWQKERLLNIALKHLPRECEAVAWLDCDVTFGREDWAARTMDALDRFRLVQVFSERHDLAAGVSVNGGQTEVSSRVSRSIGSAIQAGEVTDANLPAPDVRETLQLTVGLAWACRIDLLENNFFYDACVIGGGDRAMLSAAIGAFAAARQSLQMNTKQFEHYLRWAGPFFDSVRGRIGHVEGPAFHRWHGELRHRKYSVRHRLLADFDPATDIALHRSGCWQWNSSKPTMHTAVRGYFQSRREDD